MKACFIGLGYIGLPTAIIASHTEAIDIIGVDINPKIVEQTNKGKLHIVEPGLEEMLRNALSRKKIKAYLKPEMADAYFIVVPTPLINNKPDISYIEKATLSILPILKEGDLYVIESTSPVGTTEKMANLIFEKRPELKNKIYISYCPERVLPGNIIYELIHNDRVIGGINPESSQKAVEFYSTFVKGNLHLTNARTAELCKLTENAYRDLQIAFANEMSIICNTAKIDIWELISLANKHPRVNILQPGCGVGGHCIAIDPYFIIDAYQSESRIIKIARDVNNSKTDWCINQIINEVEKFKYKKRQNPIIGIMGLAFKPDIDDLRESPAVKIANFLIENYKNSKVNVMICEPNITTHKSFEIYDYNEVYNKSDIVVYLTAHKEFKQIDNCRDIISIDFCGVLNK